jgi:hypothetical protein
MADPSPAPKFQKGRPKVDDPKSTVLRIRCTPEQLLDWTERGQRAGMTVGAFARTVLDGSPGPRAMRRVPADRQELARIMGALGRIGGNVHMIVKGLNFRQWVPEADELKGIRQELATMRAALLAAIKRPTK